MEEIRQKQNAQQQEERTADKKEFSMVTAAIANKVDAFMEQVRERFKEAEQVINENEKAHTAKLELLTSLINNITRTVNKTKEEMTEELNNIKQSRSSKEETADREEESTRTTGIERSTEIEERLKKSQQEIRDLKAAMAAPMDRNQQRNSIIDNKIRLAIENVEYKEEIFNTWCEDVRCHIDNKDPKMCEILDYAEDQKEEVRFRDLEIKEFEDSEEKNKEIYRFLYLKTTGLAKLCVTGTPNKNGAEAWGRLSAKFNPRTKKQ